MLFLSTQRNLAHVSQKLSSASCLDGNTCVSSNMEKFLAGYGGPPAKKPKSDTKAKKKGSTCDSNKPLENRKFREP